MTEAERYRQALERLASPKAFIPRIEPIWAEPEAREIWARIDYARQTLAHVSNEGDYPMAKAKLTVIDNRLPSESDLLDIPLAYTSEYELSDHETKVLRQRIYAINKNNAVFRFRTMREFPLLLVMKIRK